MSDREYQCDCHIIHPKAVNKAVKKMPDEATFDKLIEFYKLQDPSMYVKFTTLKNSAKTINDIEDILVSVDSNMNTDPNILKVDTSIKLKKPIETFTVTFDKPKGMTDEQFEVFIKNLQKQIEENNIHKGELTS